MSVTLTVHCDGCRASATVEGTSVPGEAEAFARAFTENHGACPPGPPRAPLVGSRLPSPTAIIEAVAVDYGLTVQAILGTSRQSRIISARALAMYLCRQVRADSYPEIGKYFGRDHSTVIEACKKVERLRGEKVAGEQVTDRHVRVLQALGL